MTAMKNAQMAQSLSFSSRRGADCSSRPRSAAGHRSDVTRAAGGENGHGASLRVRDLVPALERAFREAQSGVPGPVFVEIPVDLLYDEATVREWYGMKSKGRSLGGQGG